MGRIFTTSFDEADRYYVCGTCGTHIARLESLRSATTRGGFFDDFAEANLVVLDPQQYLAVNYSMVDVNCVKCCKKLGVKIITAPNYDDEMQGWVGLEFEDLEKWNGREIVAVEIIQYPILVNPSPIAYVCKQCHTQITLPAFFQFNLALEVEELDGGIFNSVINLDSDDPAYLRISEGYAIADAFCSACNRRLGIRFVEAPEENAGMVGVVLLLWPSIRSLPM